MARSFEHFERANGGVAQEWRRSRRREGPRAGAPRTGRELCTSASCIVWTASSYGLWDRALESPRISIS